MDWQNYQQQTAATAVYPPESEGEYLLSELIDELGEVIAGVQQSSPYQDIVEELGDFTWALSQFATCKAVALYPLWGGQAIYRLQAHIPDTGDALMSLTVALGNLAGGNKKLIRDGTSPDWDEEFGGVLKALFGVAASLNTTVPYILDVNIQKLADRAARGKLHGSGGKR